MFYELIPTKLFRKDSGILTYRSDLELKPGHLVRIPLGKTTVNGIILRKVEKVDFPTKPITKLLYDTPLPSHLLKSILWLSDYYLTPLPQIASMVLPIGLEKQRRGGGSGSADIFVGRTGAGSAEFRASLRSHDFASRCAGAGSSDIFVGRREPAGRVVSQSPVKTGAMANTTEKISLNLAQQNALRDLRSTLSPTKLLHGITGSGKTNIYLELASETLKKGQSVILLVPEIALTSQVVQIFCSTFNRGITLIHSRETESERHQIWTKLLNSDQPEIVIGPRSALFAPLKNLGLIIIDEAHESTYFQENTPKYSSLRLASFIAKTKGIDCVLGSATPNIVDYHLATTKHSLVTLSEKAKKSAITPNIHLINLGNRDNFQKNRYFSDPLLKNIEQNLAHGHQTLIFHNRRGSSPLTICEKCGWQALCPHCLLPLTLHSDAFNLICHTCGFTTPTPHSCPDCGHPSVIHKGFGTKLLETELKKLFKTAKIARFDADNKKSETLDQLYQEVKNGDYQIIIGTQGIAKGLDLPKLATVGIVQADAGLSLPDYAAEERSFELITQVIGRVGRGHLECADVFIQTYQPDHPAITAAIAEDYAAFAAYLLEKRQKALLPPFTYLMKMSLAFKTEAIAIKKARALHAALSSYLSAHPSTKALLSPPTPSFHEQSSRGFSWEIIVKSRSRSTLLTLANSLPRELATAVKITLDPPSLL